MSKGKQLRALMRDGKHHYTPGITTPLHAMICEKAGFEFIYMGGYDVSLTLLGLPDVGLIKRQVHLVGRRTAPPRPAYGVCRHDDCR